MLKPFLIHLFPKKIDKNSIKTKYTFHAGIVSVILLLVLFVSGVLLMLYYVPSNEHAYNSILFIENRVFIGKFLRSFHRMASHLLLFTMTIHFLRIIFAGIYKFRSSNYKIGFLMFLMLIFCAYTGYLLPMDQLSYWATVTGMELFKILPSGKFIVAILTPDGVGGNITLIRFYTLHIIVLPFLIFLLLNCHMYNLRKEHLFHRIGTIKTNYFYKYAVKVFFITLFIVAVLSAIIGSPLGFPADPFTPPNPAKSAWFLIWIQELVSWNKYFFYFIPVSILFYFFLPEISKRRAGYEYFSRDDMVINIITIFFVIFIICLTIIGLYFRGINWQLKLPF